MASQGETDERMEKMTMNRKKLEKSGTRQTNENRIEENVSIAKSKMKELKRDEGSMKRKKGLET